MSRYHRGGSIVRSGLEQEETGSLVSAAARGCPAPDNSVTRRARLLPRLADIPIPECPQIKPSLWGEQMIEMADHIGPYHTLIIHDRFGGQKFRVPMEEAKSPVRSLLGHNLSPIFTWVYGGQVLVIARARKALEHARRAGIIAAVRAGHITGLDAAVVIGTDRKFVSYLVNHTDEGHGVKPVTLPIAREAALLQNVTRIVGEALAEAGLASLVGSFADRIMKLGDVDTEALRDALPRPTEPEACIGGAC
jgi:hypothetical protein